MLEPNIRAKNYELYLGEAESIMLQIPPHCADSIICDEPFGTTKCKWDVVIPFDLMWNGIKSVIEEKGPILLFGSQPFTSALIMSNPKMFKEEIIWQKTCPSNIASSKFVHMKYHENIICFSSGRNTFNPQMIDRMESGKKTIDCHQRNKTTFRKSATQHQPNSELVEYDPNKYDKNKKNPSSVICVPSTRPNPRLHPTQKPVALMEHLVKTYTNEGDTVLDFAMGSGSTGIACLNTNRYFIGIELDESYFNVCSKRLAEWKPIIETK